LAFGEGFSYDDVADTPDLLEVDGGVREDMSNYGHKSGPYRAIGTNDASPERIKLAGQGFSGMVEREGSVRASAIASEWVRGNAADLIGKLVTSHQHLAVSAQILRDSG
jgi:hypothetical protein